MRRISTIKSIVFILFAILGTTEIDQTLLNINAHSENKCKQVQLNFTWTIVKPLKMEFAGNRNKFHG